MLSLILSQVSHLEANADLKQTIQMTIQMAIQRPQYY